MLAVAERADDGVVQDAEYRAVARDTSLDRTLHDLDTALAAAGQCVNALLARTVLAGTTTPGRWNPARLGWDR